MSCSVQSCNYKFVALRTVATVQLCVTIPEATKELCMAIVILAYMNIHTLQPNRHCAHGL